MSIVYNYEAIKKGVDELHGKTENETTCPDSVTIVHRVKQPREWGSFAEYSLSDVDYSQIEKRVLEFMEAHHRKLYDHQLDALAFALGRDKYKGAKYLVHDEICVDSEYDSQEEFKQVVHPPWDTITGGRWSSNDRYKK